MPPAAQPMRHPPCHRRLTDLVAAVADLRAAQHRLHQAEAARASAERLRSVASAPQPPAAGDPTAASRPRTAAEIAALSFAAGPRSGCRDRHQPAGRSRRRGRASGVGPVPSRAAAAGHAGSRAGAAGQAGSRPTLGRSAGSAGVLGSPCRLPSPVTGTSPVSPERGQLSVVQMLAGCALAPSGTIWPPLGNKKRMWY